MPTALARAFALLLLLFATSCALPLVTNNDDNSSDTSSHADADLTPDNNEDTDGDDAEDDSTEDDTTGEDDALDRMCLDTKGPGDPEHGKDEGDNGHAKGDPCEDHGKRDPNGNILDGPAHPDDLPFEDQHFADVQLPGDDAGEDNWLEGDEVRLDPETADNLLAQIHDQTVTVDELDDNAKAPAFTSLSDGAVFPENIGAKNIFAWTNPGDQFDYFYLVLELPIAAPVEAKALKKFLAEQSDEDTGDESTSNDSDDTTEGDSATSGGSDGEEPNAGTAGSDDGDDGYQIVEFLSKDTKFTPEETLWKDILAKTARDKDIFITLHGIVVGAEDRIARIVKLKERMHIRILAEKLGGTLYFWRIYDSATPGPKNDGSIMIMPANGAVSPVPFYGKGSKDPKYSGFCAGCHSITPNGEQYAIVEHRPGQPSHGDTHFGDIADAPGPSRAKIPTDDHTFPKPGTPQDEKAVFTDFNPMDNDWVVYSKKGDLYFKQVSTGQSGLEIAFTAANTTTHVETMPTWSRSGQVAFARCKSLNNQEGFDVKGPCDIYTITPTLPIDGTASVPAAALKGASDGEMNYYPDFSPDGDYIAFTYHPLATNGSSTYADPARNKRPEIGVFVVPSTGGTRTPIVPAIWKPYINSWSTWGKYSEWYGPSAMKIEHNWIAFSSNFPLYPASPRGSQLLDMNIFIARVSFVGGTVTVSPPVPLPRANLPVAGEHLPRWVIK